ncbi:MAG: DUF4368 domain-containing protein, partial [Anaerovorax sp.]
IKIQDITQIKLQNLEKELNDILSKIQCLNKAITTSYLDKIKELIDEEQFAIINSQLMEEKFALEERHKSIKMQIDKIRDISMILPVDKDKVFQQYRHLDELTHQALNTFIDYIVVSNTDKINSKNIEIHWKF